MSTESQDDQVLKRLYKEGAKEAPSAKLDEKILEYAANKNKSKGGDSHFGGGWKVPLSLAASVVLVFAILVQLDQSPEQLEMPPMPTSDKSDTQSAPADELFETDSEVPIYDKQNKEESKRKLEQEVMSGPESTLEKSQQSENFRLNNEGNLKQAPEEGALGSSSQTKPKVSTPSASGAKYPKKTRERFEDSAKDSSSKSGVDDIAPARSVEQKSTQEIQSEEVIMQDRADEPIVEGELEYAPLPVEDWLLMIEQLIAQKDYAEAARQLEKFKQAHPKVNVEDLEAKLP